MSELVSNRKTDSKQEKLFNQFLFDYFFSKINKTSKLIYDRELQIAGVDLQFNGAKTGNLLNVDIKAQSSKKYLNAPRPTFLLELSSINRYGEDFVGWFLNPDLITDYYAFMWIPKAKVNADGGINSPDDIEEAEVMLVSKKKIKTYISELLKRKGYDDLQSVIDDMRINEIERIPLEKGINFSHTPTLYEKPVNIVVHKNILKKFSIAHYIVTKETIKKI